MDSTLDRLYDWTAFQRLDNAAVVDFLASSAAAFCELGLISRKDTDDLRVSLSGFHASLDKQSRPLLLELERDHGDFLKILLSRYGVFGLSLNLLRHTLVSRLDETRRILAEFGQTLVTRSGLLFNRSMYLYSGGKRQKQTLFSCLLVEWAEKIAESEIRLGVIRQSINVMIGHEMAGSKESDMSIDESVALAQGFCGVHYPALIGHAESEIQHDLSHIIGHIARVSSLFLKQIAFNLTSEAAYAALATTEWLEGEAERLEHPDLLEGANLFAMEMRRRHLLSTLAGINGILGQTMTLVTQALSSIDGNLKADEADLPDATLRRLAFELIVSGTSPHHAFAAGQALIRYLTDHRIHAKDVIVGELSRIHPSLTPSVLDVLIGLTNGQSGSLDPFPHKATTMLKASQLSGAFSKVLSNTIVPLLAAFLVIPGCGLKTNPRSEVVEFRPDIPFREQSAFQEMGPPRPVEMIPGPGESSRRP